MKVNYNYLFSKFSWITNAFSPSVEEKNIGVDEKFNSGVEGHSELGKEHPLVFTVKSAVKIWLILIV